VAALRPVTRRFAPSATSPVSLRYTVEERDREVSLLTRETGEVARLAKRDVTEGAQSR